MIYKDINKWMQKRKSINRKKEIGVIMTMGALHQGHLSLVKKSIEENDVTIVTIFVNPTQFDDKNDLKYYPQSLTEDQMKLSKMNVDFFLLPSKKDMYHNGNKYEIRENSFSKELCGRFRPKHFNGVLTIVMKFLNIVQATRAYFGEKDYQQLQLIKSMVSTFFIPTKIVSCSTIRNSYGLPLSSRNSKLTNKDLILANSFAKIIRKKINIQAIQKKLKDLNITVDYLEDIDNRRYVAVRINNIRLIDNFSLNSK